VRTGEAGAASIRDRNAQGGYRWFLSRIELLRAQWVGVNLDIEELKCAQQAFRESEAKFRDYAENASVNRLTMMGELIASLAHEITQPIATARNNVRAALRFLDRSPPTWVRSRKR